MKLLVLVDDEKLFDLASEIADFLNADASYQAHDLSAWKILYRQYSTSSYEGLFLIQQDKGMSLLSLVQSMAMKPIHVNFSSHEWQRRLFNISSKTELAAKALGLGVSKAESYRLIDTNAGLGQDLFVFAALGAEVQACERSALVFLLLQNALQRAHSDSKLAEIVERIQLSHTDAINYLNKLTTNSGVNAVYLDPMFPEKKHQAASKKEMQIFQALVGVDEDEFELYQAAQNYKQACDSCTRIVLKRPRLASVYEPDKLGRQLQGNSTRFDIYF